MDNASSKPESLALESACSAECVSKIRGAAATLIVHEAFTHLMKSPFRTAREATSRSIGLDSTFAFGQRPPQQGLQNDSSPEEAHISSLVTLLWGMLHDCDRRKRIKAMYKERRKTDRAGKARQRRPIGWSRTCTLSLCTAALSVVQEHSRLILIKHSKL